MNTPTIEFKPLALPKEHERQHFMRATNGSAGIDLASTEDAWMHAGKKHPFHMGFAIHIKTPSIFAMIAPRSGLATTHGIELANTVGIIDSDYQGEIIVILRKREHTGSYFIKAGTRIAQMIFLPVVYPHFKTVTEFEAPSARGTGGFGSTGD